MKSNIGSDVPVDSVGMGVRVKLGDSRPNGSRVFRGTAFLSNMTEAYRLKWFRIYLSTGKFAPNNLWAFLVANSSYAEVFYELSVYTVSQLFFSVSLFDDAKPNPVNSINPPAKPDSLTWFVSLLAKKNELLLH